MKNFTKIFIMLLVPSIAMCMENTTPQNTFQLESKNGNVQILSTHFESENPKRAQRIQRALIKDLMQKNAVDSNTPSTVHITQYDPSEASHRSIKIPPHHTVRAMQNGIEMPNKRKAQQKYSSYYITYFIPHQPTQSQGDISNAMQQMEI